MTIYFAQLTLPELVPILSIIASIFAGFFALERARLRAEEKERKENSLERRTLTTSNVADRENERTERMALIKAIDNMSCSNQKIAEATEKAAREAKERNGHLAELQLKSQEMFQLLADRNYEAITNIAEQHVTTQIVEHETVKDKE